MFEITDLKRDSNKMCIKVPICLYVYFEQLIYNHPYETKEHRIFSRGHHFGILHSTKSSHKRISPLTHFKAGTT